MLHLLGGTHRINGANFIMIIHDKTPKCNRKFEIELNEGELKQLLDCVNQKYHRTPLISLRDIIALISIALNGKEPEIF